MGFQFYLESLTVYHTVYVRNEPLLVASLEECKKRIRDKTSERHTGLPTVKLGVQDFEMILKTLTEDGYIQVKKTRNKSPYDLVYTI